MRPPSTAAGPPSSSGLGVQALRRATGATPAPTTRCAALKRSPSSPPLHHPHRLQTPAALKPRRASRQGSSPTTTTTSRRARGGGGRRPPPHDDDGGDDGYPRTAAAATALGGGAVVGLGALALIAGLSLGAREPIEAFVSYFKEIVDELGPAGYVAYGAVYFALEVLCVPAIPLTATAGALFGLGAGTAVVSVSATAAATVAFLIARYAARDRVAAWAAASPRFTAVDRAVGRQGFKVVTLLRLSPLLPLAASSYLYGLTSVDLGAYVAGSWLGMLPGTVAYVAAGAYGLELLEGGGNGGGLAGAGGGGGGPAAWQVGLGLALSAASILYVGKLAAAALAEEAGLEEED